VLLGPAVEEAIFRGALFRPLRQKHGPFTVIAVTALCFAAVHLDPHRLLPFALVGAALATCAGRPVRRSCRSCSTPVQRHAHGGSVAAASPAAGRRGDEVSGSAILLSSAVCLVSLALFHLICRTSRLASAARRAD